VPQGGFIWSGSLDGSTGRVMSGRSRNPVTSRLVSIAVVAMLVPTGLGTLAAVLTSTSARAATDGGPTPLATPTLLASPSSGPVGTIVSLSASGFAPTSSIGITWNGGLACSGPVNASGAFACVFTIPRATGGSHPFVGTDTASNTATAAFSLLPTLEATPTAGVVGTTVSFAATGFGGTIPIHVSWPGGMACNGVTDATGSFTCLFTLPAMTAGPHTFSAIDSVPNTATATVTVASQLSVAPSSGHVGTAVTVAATGYAGTSTTTVSWSGGTVCSGTTGAAGGFTCSWSIPSTTGGPLVLTGTDAASDAAHATFTVLPLLVVSPTAGLGGTVVSFEGSNFAASSAVTVAWVDGTACTATTAAGGGFACTFTLPVGTPGGTYVFTGTDAASNSAQASFLVPSLLSTAPASGPVGTTLAFSATGFAVSSGFSITWTRGTACSGTTTASGGFGCTYPVLPTPAGTYTFTGTDVPGDVGTTTFTVVPQLTVTPPTGPAGTALVVSGTGFGAGAAVTVNWTFGAVCTATATALGNFSCGYTVPSGTPVGTYPVTAVDASRHTATTAFTLPGGHFVFFREMGLPLHATWQVRAGLAAVLRNNTTTTRGGVVSYQEPNGTLPFTITPPSGFGVWRVSGGSATTQTSVTVTGNTTLTVRFGPVVTLTFNAVGLPSGTLWGVTITPELPGGGPAPQEASVRGASIGFSVVKGTYRYTVSEKPVVYQAGSGSPGSVVVPGHNVSKKVTFKLLTQTVVFVEHGLPATTVWTVSVAGPMNLSRSSSTGKIKLVLENGTYTYTVSNFTAWNPHPASGSLTVVAPLPPQTHVVNYTSSGPAPPGRGHADAPSGSTAGPVATTRLAREST